MSPEKYTNLLGSFPFDIGAYILKVFPAPLLARFDKLVEVSFVPVRESFL